MRVLMVRPRLALLVPWPHAWRGYTAAVATVHTIWRSVGATSGPEPSVVLHGVPLL